MQTNHSLKNQNQLIQTDDQRQDRNFDTIADHFEKKVYGGLKGEIRLAVLRRDILDYAEQMSQKIGRPLRILDVGAGLAQIAIELATKGHALIINDISANMLDKAQAAVNRIEALKTDSHVNVKAAIENTLDIEWIVAPYQQLNEKFASDKSEKFDLILCHALLEWLAEPSQIMDFFDQHLTADGALSLCFYNPASFDYRNLIMGNFNLLDRLVEGSYTADNKKSLTPNHPVARQEVESWLSQHDYQIALTSGLRVFSDYTPLKRGGLNDSDAVIKMELRYSQQEPFKWLGRYLHILATR